MSRRDAACVAERNSGGVPACVARTHKRVGCRLGDGTHDERGEQERET